MNLKSKPEEPTRRRTPLGRTHRIKELIAQGNFPNAETLARELEVNVRTIQRDLDLMRDVMRMPIAYHPGERGFYFTAPVEPMRLTESEMFALLVAQKVVQQYQGTPLYAPLDVAFRKLTAGLNTSDRTSTGSFECISIRRFAPEDTDVHTMQVVSKALANRQAVRFNYRSVGHEAGGIRTVRPYELTDFDARWYLLGHDSKRKTVRTFALCRIAGPELTGERYEIPPDFNANKNLERSVGIMEGKEDHQVVIELDRWLTNVFRGRRLNATQEVVELPNGGSRLTVRVNCLEEITRWVLSWGTHATVIGPDALRIAVAAASAEVARKYGEFAV